MSVSPVDAPARTLLDENLRALAAVSPALADQIRSIAVPATVTAATGRDGRATYRLPDPAGQSIWLGRSSMPSVSAAALVEDCPDTGANVLLPSIGTGLEAVLLAGKLPAYCAVFVRLDDLLAARLALSLYDYAPDLLNGRIVLVPPGEPEDSLTAFFAAHPGYEFPTRMIRIPTLAPADLAGLVHSLELSGRRVAEVQTAEVERIVARLRSRPRRAIPPRPRVAVLTVDARAQTLSDVNAVAAAMAELGWSCTVCAPDRPQRCHVAARLAAVESAGADVVLMLNCAAGQTGALVPDRLPLVSWFLPSAAETAGFAGAAEARFLCLVSSPRLHAAARRAGIEDDRIETLATGARTPWLAARPATGGPAFGRSVGGPAFGRSATGEQSAFSTAGTVLLDQVDVAILADVCDDRAEAANIALASYARLYDALRRRARDRLDATTPAAAEELIRECEGPTAVTLSEAVLREQFLAMILTRIMPAARLRAGLDELARRGRSVRVWGAVDGNLEGTEPVECRALPVGPDVRALFDSARVVFVPTPWPDWSQWMLDALFARCPVVAAVDATNGPRGAGAAGERAGPSEAADRNPLAEVFSRVHWFSRLKDGLRTVERLLSEGRPGAQTLDRRSETGGRCPKQVQPETSSPGVRLHDGGDLGEETLAAHSLGARLIEMLDIVRARNQGMDTHEP